MSATTAINCLYTEFDSDRADKIASEFAIQAYELQNVDRTDIKEQLRRIISSLQEKDIPLSYLVSQLYIQRKVPSSPERIIKIILELFPGDRDTAPHPSSETRYNH